MPLTRQNSFNSVLEISLFPPPVFLFNLMVKIFQCSLCKEALFPLTLCTLSHCLRLLAKSGDRHWWDRARPAAREARARERRGGRRRRCWGDGGQSRGLESVFWGQAWTDTPRCTTQQMLTFTLQSSAVHWPTIPMCNLESCLLLQTQTCKNRIHASI